VAVGSAVECSGDPALDVVGRFRRGIADADEVDRIGMLKLKLTRPSGLPAAVCLAPRGC